MDKQTVFHVWNVDTMRCDSAFYKEILTCATAQMGLEDMMLCGVRPLEKRQILQDSIFLLDKKKHANRM